MGSGECGPFRWRSQASDPLWAWNWSRMYRVFGTLTHHCPRYVRWLEHFGWLKYTQYFYGRSTVIRFWELPPIKWQMANDLSKVCEACSSVGSIWEGVRIHPGTLNEWPGIKSKTIGPINCQNTIIINLGMSVKPHESCVSYVRPKGSLSNVYTRKVCLKIPVI